MGCSFHLMERTKLCLCSSDLLLSLGYGVVPGSAKDTEEILWKTRRGQELLPRVNLLAALGHTPVLWKSLAKWILQRFLSGCGCDIPVFSVLSPLSKSWSFE